MYKEEQVSPINPTYYRSHPSGVECIDIVRGLPFSQGNAIKYLWRAGDKGGPEKLREDLSKALWYTTDALVTESWTVAFEIPSQEHNKVEEAISAWLKAEPPGYRQKCLFYLFTGDLSKTQKTIIQWINELD